MEKITSLFKGLPSWASIGIKILLFLVPFSTVIFIVYKLYSAGVSIIGMFSNTETVKEKTAILKKIVVPAGFTHLKTDAYYSGVASQLYQALNTGHWGTYAPVFALLKPLSSGELIYVTQLFGAQSSSYLGVSITPPMTLIEWLLYKYSGTDLDAIKYLFKFTNLL